MNAKVLLFLAIILPIGPTAHADILYTYHGRPFQTNVALPGARQITLALVTLQPLADGTNNELIGSSNVVSLIMSDGIDTIQNGQGTLSPLIPNNDYIHLVS